MEDNESVFVFSSANKDVAIVLDPARQLNAIMAFTVRTGGCSYPPYGSLNFSSKEGDDEQKVQQNLALLAAQLAIEPEYIVFPEQVHGTAIEIVYSVPRLTPTADALITPNPGIFVAVKTADCMPILLLDPVRKISAAVHAGWKGTVLGILRKAVNLMCKEFGTDPSDMIAALGPGIGLCCYEVDGVVLEPFRQAFPNADRFIITSEKLKPEEPGDKARMQLPSVQSEKSNSLTYHLDLLAASRSELIAAGLASKNVYSIELCTACHPELFFSHRRDRGKTGRQLGLVGFRA